VLVVVLRVTLATPEPGRPRCPPGAALARRLAVRAGVLVRR
jgi:hypothetical protein